MKKLTSLTATLTNNFKIQYFGYEISSKNFGLFSINYNGNDGLYIRPVRYIDDNLNGYKRNIIDYTNLNGNKMQDFLNQINEYSYSLTEKEFLYKWNSWIKLSQKAGKQIKL